MNTQTVMTSVPLWMAAPFALLLAAIAAGPHWFGQWWDRHYTKLIAGFSAIVMAYYLFVLRAPSRVLEMAWEYVSFMVIIASLFVVSGGIHITVKGKATPVANVIFLLIGALAANLLGTTGASMLLIRPWLRVNRGRLAAYHVIFFIFLVSNVGGCLTPLGPPLFLGYLMGVPFWWTTLHCLPMWCLGVGLLLVMFYFVDYKNCGKTGDAASHEEWRFEGMSNLLFLAVILGAALISHPPFLREGLMLAAAAGSYYSTPRKVHEANQFDFRPMKEVAILFIGIFATMIPALDWLQFNSGKWQGASPAVFYFSSGGLSSVLDNAPTYLCFFKVIGGHLDTRLLAISVGSVFFGACTYIGNGPNFMIKAIADQEKVRMPTFLGYVINYTIPFMLPALLAVWLVFFR